MTTESRLVASGSIVFAAEDNLTVEKKTEIIEIGDKYSVLGLFLLVVEKPVENTAGDLTVNVYSLIKIDGTNERDVLHTSLLLQKITDAATYEACPIQGLFVGGGKARLGCKFAVDSGAITVYYKLYSL